MMAAFSLRCLSSLLCCFLYNIGPLGIRVVILLLTVLLSCFYLQGQLGLGDTIDRAIPTLVPSLSDKLVVRVACGDRYGIAITG